MYLDLDQLAWEDDLSDLERIPFDSSPKYHIGYQSRHLVLNTPRYNCKYVGSLNELISFFESTIPLQASFLGFHIAYLGCNIWKNDHIHGIFFIYKFTSHSLIVDYETRNHR